MSEPGQLDDEEAFMKFLLNAAAAAAFCLALPAFAATSGTNPADSASSGSTSQQHRATHPMTREKVKSDPEQMGFKNVQALPQSFLVRVENKDGNPMMMIINPDSVTSVTALSGPPGSGSSSSGASGTESSGMSPSSGSSRAAGTQGATTE
jgi:hypothetical protein